MCVSVLPSLVYVCVLCPQLSEKSAGSLGIEVTGGCEPPHGWWELNPSPQQDQPMLLMAEGLCSLCY